NIAIFLSSCTGNTLYTVFFYNISSGEIHEIGQLNEKSYSIDYTDFDFSVLENGISAGLIGVESDNEIGICPFSYVHYSPEQLQIEDFLFIENLFVSESESLLNVTWYLKETKEKVRFVSGDELYLYVNIGYYSSGVHIFGVGAYKFDVNDIMGRNLESIYIYNIESGFTITLDSSSSLLSRFAFSRIAIANTEDNIEVFLPFDYIGGVLIDELNSTDKIIYSFGNQSIELYARPIVKR
ncbi:MAG: hypothetical protein CVV58_00955, partial [Tenericutes bacterium HGW-Tenericutes-3]